MDLHFQNKQKPRFFFSFAFSPLNSLFYHLEIFSLIASYNRVKFDPTMSTLEKKIKSKWPGMDFLRKERHIQFS